MKTKTISTVMTVLLVTGIASARKDHFYEKGNLVEMRSQECGSEEKGARGVGGVLLGTDSQHRKTRDLLCPEYVLRSDKIEYRIRPKDEKHPILLPVGEQVEFRIHKDRMLLRVPEGDDKEREYFVVSMTPRVDAAASTRASTQK